MNAIDSAVSWALARKRAAWTLYMKCLHAAPDADPSDDEVAQLFDAVKEIGLPWVEIRGDQAALHERRKLESTIAQAEKIIDEAQTIVVGNHELVAALDRTQEKTHATDLSADYRTPTLKIAEAQREQSNAGIRIEKAEERLRKLRIENPRAFNLFPEVSL